MKFRPYSSPCANLCRLPQGNGVNGGLSGASASCALVLVWTALAGPSFAEDPFVAQIQPLLAQRCYDCHGQGASEAGVALDAAETDAAVRHDPQLWLRVLKQIRSGLMPPEGDKLSRSERRMLEDWVKSEVFHYDGANPDPGRVTLRRLNRVEYGRTIRDLLAVEFDPSGSFPPDDTGHGFDNVADVLTVSPMLMEKYLEAATEIVGRAVPLASRVVREATLPGARLLRTDAPTPPEATLQGPFTTSFYEPCAARLSYPVPEAGDYVVSIDFSVNEVYVDGMFDYNKARLTWLVDGEERHSEEYSWQGEEGDYHVEFFVEWQPGEHEVTLRIEPLTPDQEQIRSLSFRVQELVVAGPLAKDHWVEPPRYRQFFPRDVPEDPDGRLDYARELLRDFADRAFRRPAPEGTVERLARLAELTYDQPGETFEAGVAKAMTAVLASPRFLFREEAEQIDPADPLDDRPYRQIDEYALASRLSYFLWSTMPDDELTQLARRGRLRARLGQQVERMLKDPKAEEFTRSFVGQWLQTRDVDAILINSFVVAARDQKPNPEFDRLRQRFRQLNRKPPDELTDEERKELDESRRGFREMFGRFRKFDLNGELRTAMRRETEMQFEYIVRENRPLTELLACNYTFVNERLAEHYGVEGVKGGEMRRVELPPDSLRGGVLTQGSVLVVTSNPDRTSPVKRGLFILDNILGTPPAPPPPNVPALEEQDPQAGAVTLTLRENLEKHRESPLCFSCHARMDPLGLALENFNALGIYREQERGLPIDAAAQLNDEEQFANVRELKELLVRRHREEFYRTLTEKLLTYAIGRGLEYYDVGTVDEIVARLERAGGKPSALILGVARSAPFQKRRTTAAADAAGRTAQLDPHAAGVDHGP